MTIREISNAIDGFEKLRKDNFQERLYCARVTSFWAYKGWAGKRLRKYDQLFEMESDVKARRERLKGMKPAEIIYG